MEPQPTCTPPPPGRIILLGLVALATILLSGPSDAECFDSLGRPIRSGGTSGVEAVFAADVDGDGDLDVLSASFGDDTIAWHESDAADTPPGTPPAFTRHVISAFANSASAVLAADLDGDGDLDALSASTNDDTIAWYPNLAGPGEAPVFLTRFVSRDADGASDVFVALINDDEHLDILSASIEDDKIAWYENDGGTSPTFTEHVVTTSANGAASVYAADLDGDDDVDILSASRLNDRIAWYEQTLDENMETVFVQRLITANAKRAADVIAIDLDGDGDVDVLSASSGDNKIAWYENNGATGENVPTFTKRTISTAVQGARSVHVVDFDADGSLDVLATAGGGGEVVWFENLTPLGGGLPVFAAKKTISNTIASPDAVIAADLDDNGSVDAIVAASIPGSPARGDRIAWFPNDVPVPAVFSERIVSIGAIAPTVVLADQLNDDDNLDVVVASIQDDMVAWYENDGVTSPGVPGFTLRAIDMDAGAPSDAFVIDLEGDDDLDLLVAAEGDGSIVWYENEGGPTPLFGTKRVISSNTEGASSVFAIDLDADGDVDVLSASRDDDTIAWHASDAAQTPPGTVPSFTERVISSLALGARSVFAIDVDGDGDLDVLSASSDDNLIAWYESDLADEPAPPLGGDPPEATLPGFTERVISVASVGARAVSAGDLDGDGDIDVLAASALDDTVSWFEQTQEREIGIVWTERAVVLNADFARTVDAVDFDGDGDLDVLAASSGDDTVAWFENDIPEGETVPAFTERFISTRLDEVRSVAVGDVDLDGEIDIVSGYFFEVAWHAGGITVDACGAFDASGDQRIDGIELTYLGAAFAESCVDAGAPTEWWATTNDIDLDDNCLVDGNDLSILTDRGVWGETPDTCSYTCQDATLIALPRTR